MFKCCDLKAFIHFFFLICIILISNTFKAIWRHAEVLKAEPNIINTGYLTEVINLSPTVLWFFPVSVKQCKYIFNTLSQVFNIHTGINYKRNTVTNIGHKYTDTIFTYTFSINIMFKRSLILQVINIWLQCPGIFHCEIHGKCTLHMVTTNDGPHSSHFIFSFCLFQPSARAFQCTHTHTHTAVEAWWTDWAPLCQPPL